MRRRFQVTQSPKFDPSYPFDRSEIKFEKTEDGKLWLLKSRMERPERSSSDCGDNRIYHFAVSLILAAYGLDGSHVEIDDKKIIIKMMGVRLLLMHHYGQAATGS